MKIDETLSEVFDLEPIEYKQLKPSVTDLVPDETEEKYIDNDYASVRQNMRELLIHGETALLDALEVAKQSENPRAYEVVGTLIKQLADINQQLLDIHQQKQKLSGIDKKKEDTKQVTNNNAIFVGSTNDLAKMIQKMNSGE